MAFLQRPAGGSKAGAIWVSSWRPWRLHLADCDYFVDPPVLATEEQENTLELCEWCSDRMGASLLRQKLRWTKAG